MCGDIRFRLIDTAGIRHTDDNVEEMGVMRAVNIIKQADIILSVAEPGGEFLCADDSRTVLVENKNDLCKGAAENAVSISALTGEGLGNLKKVLYEKARSLTAAGVGTINNIRHLQAVEEAIRCITDALKAIDQKLPPDLVSDDLMGAYRALGSITGITGSDSIVDEIFSRFCVGK